MEEIHTSPETPKKKRPVSGNGQEAPRPRKRPTNEGETARARQRSNISADERETPRPKQRSTTSEDEMRLRRRSTETGDASKSKKRAAALEDETRSRKRPTETGDAPRPKKRPTNPDGQKESAKPKKRAAASEDQEHPRKKFSSGKGSGKKRRRKKKQQMDTLSLVLLLVAVVVFCFSAFSLIRIGLNYKKGTDTYQDLEASVVTEATPDGTEDQPDNADTRAMAYTPPYVNFDSLLQINPETEAWILLPDTKINYPVVKHTDNAYYLNHMIDGTSNSAGTLFIDTNNSNNFADQNTIIYGHNMKNGSMFGQLKKYGKEDFYKEHPCFYVYTKDGVWEYDIFSVRVVDELSDSYTMTFASTDAYRSYLDQAVRKSMYDTTVSADVTDSIITLSTCTSKDTDRLIVQAVRGEKIR